MKKNSAKPANQLSLFDNFEEHKNYGGTMDGSTGWSHEFLEKLKTYENDSNKNFGRNEGDVGQQPGSDLQNGPEELQSQTAVFTAEGPTTGTVLPDENGGHVDSLPERNDMAILPTGEGTDGPGHDGISGGGNGLAGSGTTGRSVNYHNTSMPDGSLSFSKPKHLRDNIAALEMLHLLDHEQRPATKEEQEVLSRYSGWGGLKEILLDPSIDSK